ncbi:MAG TPA: hypothetical protein VFM07_09335 [Intrasporangium sp.]|nr:hypothetical protein [Intrasporangium sp.]
MVNGFTGRVSENPAIPASVASTIATQTRAKGLEVVSVQQAQGLGVQAGLPADQASAVADDYGEAQLQGLRYALFAGAILAVLAFWFTRHLPDTPLAPEPSRRRTRPEEVRGAAPRSAEQHTR